MLIACLTSHALNDVNDPVYTPKSQRWRVVVWATNALRYGSKGMAKAIDYVDANIILRSRHKLAKAIAFTSKPRKRINLVQIAAVAAVFCYPAGTVDLKQNLLNRYSNIASFDTDSECSPIGVDNRCSACISDDRDDFEGPLMATKRVIKGFGGVTTKGVQTGTLLWRWADDTGKTHSFRIPNSYYVPQGGVKLISPQHLAQSLKDVRGTGEETNGKECVLYWNNHQHRLTIPL